MYASFFREGAPKFAIFLSVLFQAELFGRILGINKGSREIRGHAPPKIFKKFTHCSGHYSTF